MPEVTIAIGGREFEVACREGEEQYLHSAAKMLDQEAQVLNQSIGRVPETKMLLMSGLMLADRTANVEDQLQKLKDAPAEAPVDQNQVELLSAQLQTALSSLSTAEARATSAEANLSLAHAAAEDARAAAATAEQKANEAAASQENIAEIPFQRAVPEPVEPIVDTAEQDRLTAELAKLQAAYDGLTADKSALITEIDNVKASKSSLKAEIDQMSEANATASEEADSLRLEKEELNVLLTNVTNEMSTLRSENSDVLQALKDVVEETEAVSQSVEQAN
jgi:cell division protein ZapA